MDLTGRHSATQGAKVNPHHQVADVSFRNRNLLYQAKNNEDASNKVPDGSQEEEILMA